MPADTDARCRELYLDLLKNTLAGLIYDDDQIKGMWVQVVRKGVRALRLEGRDWPVRAHTMVGRLRLDNVQHCAERVLAENVPGDFIEAGVWRGGVTILMRAILCCHGDTSRAVWVADSFKGVPRPQPALFPADRGLNLHRVPYLAVSRAEVAEHFARYGLLDGQVRFLEGWFRDTLPSAPIERLALLRIDGDLYESTRDALVHLYPKLSLGGYVIVDDYGHMPSCRQAVTDYRLEHGISEDIVAIDHSGVFWQRQR
jgi:hypothetical protein